MCLPRCPLQAQDDASWKVLEVSSEGYEIAIRRERDRELPTMRGRGVIKAELFHLLAVILDARRAPEWAVGVSATRLLAQESAFTALIYSLTELSWPVSDRDIVARAKLTIGEPGRDYVLSMKAEPDALPKEEGVVRIRLADTHFHLRKQADDRVWIEYQVNIDPGGRLPKWLLRWAAKGVPLETLRQLQTQVDKTRGQYTGQIEKLRSLR